MIDETRKGKKENELVDLVKEFVEYMEDVLEDCDFDGYVISTIDSYVRKFSEICDRML